jgi:hypothetical protein
LVVCEGVTERVQKVSFAIPEEGVVSGEIEDGEIDLTISSRASKFEKEGTLSFPHLPIV